VTADTEAGYGYDGELCVTAVGGMRGMQKELEWHGSICLKTEETQEN